MRYRITPTGSSKAWEILAWAVAISIVILVLVYTGKFDLVAGKLEAWLRAAGDFINIFN